MPQYICQLILPLDQYFCTFSGIVVLSCPTEGQSPILQHSEYPSCICMAHCIFEFAEDKGISDEIDTVGKHIIRVLLLSLFCSCSSGKFGSNLCGQHFDVLHSGFPFLKVRPPSEAFKDPIFDIFRCRNVIKQT